jgi:hypothetical protein
MHKSARIRTFDSNEQERKDRRLALVGDKEGVSDRRVPEQEVGLQKSKRKIGLFLY